MVRQYTVPQIVRGVAAGGTALLVAVLGSLLFLPDNSVSRLVVVGTVAALAVGGTLATYRDRTTVAFALVGVLFLLAVFRLSTLGLLVLPVVVAQALAAVLSRMESRPAPGRAEVT